MYYFFQLFKNCVIKNLLTVLKNVVHLKNTGTIYFCYHCHKKNPRVLLAPMQYAQRQRLALSATTGNANLYSRWLIRFVDEKRADSMLALNLLFSK